MLRSHGQHFWSRITNTTIGLFVERMATGHVERYDGDDPAARSYDDSFAPFSAIAPMSRPQPQDHGSVTELLQAIGNGSADLDELYRRVESQFRRMAMRLVGISYNRPETTEILDDAFWKLTASKKLTWENRAYFFAAAAKTMRNLVINHYRKLNTAKRNHGQPAVTWPSAGILDVTIDPAQIVEVDDIWNDLATSNPVAMMALDLSAFGGWNQAEIAELLELSPRAVQSLIELGRELIDFRLK